MTHRKGLPWLPLPRVLAVAVRKVGTAQPGAMVRRGLAENA